ncbi:hypothetical protein B0H65DRAFT_550243 [Neurospora tetraspora]|uniref:Uncharacterized protein n=1 Tax=Neurospora tetraspora TaxID=94610 RepID=A0AAE0JE28_9PEZI|nr:hypothetical protein B0H65DRAFT_550243 [Neurospora tetraspora]
MRVPSAGSPANGLLRMQAGKDRVPTSSGRRGNVRGGEGNQDEGVPAGPPEGQYQVDFRPDADQHQLQIQIQFQLRFPLRPQLQVTLAQVSTLHWSLSSLPPSETLGSNQNSFHFTRPHPPRAKCEKPPLTLVFGPSIP